MYNKSSLKIRHCLHHQFIILLSFYKGIRFFNTVQCGRRH